MAAAVLTLLALAPAAGATVIGHLDVANCSGGGVTVTATSIDWIPPVDGTTGCAITGVNTNITYSGGTLSGGATGSIKDLTPSNPLPVTDFLTFSTAPGLHFDLTMLGPGASNLSCTSSLDPNAPACAVFAGSPFILQSTATGTSVTLSASGVARDTSATVSNWLGAFTTQIAGLTPAQIKATVLSGGSVTSTFSGDFAITVVPEPGTLGSMALGALLVGGSLIRRRRPRKA
jgi:hypothetical protein